MKINGECKPIITDKTAVRNTGVDKQSQQKGRFTRLQDTVTLGNPQNGISTEKGDPVSKAINSYMQVAQSGCINQGGQNNTQIINNKFDIFFGNSVSKADSLSIDFKDLLTLIKELQEFYRLNSQNAHGDIIIIIQAKQ